MMVMQWVINSLTVDDHWYIMEDFSNFNIGGTKSNAILIIHHILSITNTTTHGNWSILKITQNFHTNKSKDVWKKSKAETSGMITLSYISSNFTILLLTQYFPSTYRRNKSNGKMVHKLNGSLCSNLDSSSSKI